MTPEEEIVVRPQGVPGRTTITPRALNRLAVGIVRDASQVGTNEVSLDLTDVAGALRASVTVPVALDHDDVTPLGERASNARNEIVARMQELSGRTLTAVDVRYSGVRAAQEKRVS